MYEGPIAHRRRAQDGTWLNHPLIQHLRKTAKLAQAFALPFAPQLAHLAGLWHDLGKYSQAFQHYIRTVTEDAEHAHIEDARKPGRVDHSTAGAQYAHLRFGPQNPIAYFLSYAIAGHHAGLPDYLTEGEGCLANRLQKTVPNWQEPMPAVCQQDWPPLPGVLDLERPFGISFVIRMIFSCLVDADFLDTEAFHHPGKSRLRGQWPSLAELQRRFQRKAAARKAANQVHATLVNRLRDEVFDNCIQASAWKAGFFSLTVMTGLGKTLSTLAFALEHALRFNKSRIIYAIPYTSIIQQTAKRFREEFDGGGVLEHHANFQPEEEDANSRLASENWDAPVVVTTNVQLFESLFASQPSRCRKLHRLANSVIILDEAQVLPHHVLKPCLKALDELVVSYGCTVVLCTATQPAFKDGLGEDAMLRHIREIMVDPSPPQLAAQLNRVRFRDTSSKQVTWPDLAADLRQHPQVLCIVNTRGHARQLYQALDDVDALHLSALMCPAHRKLVIEKINRRLKAGKPCRVVSTQLVEAGVDFDFPVVYRAFAGLDSILQAAGRCNREGHLDHGQVVLFLPEAGYGHKTFEKQAQIAKDVLEHGDFEDLATMRAYFQTLFQNKRFDQSGKDHFDKHQIIQKFTKAAGLMQFPFRTVAKQFQMIEDGGESVIISYGRQGTSLIDELLESENQRGWFRRLQPYAVNLRPDVFKRLKMHGSIEVVHNQYPVLRHDHVYSEQLGLMDDKVLHWPESLLTQQA